MIEAFSGFALIGAIVGVGWLVKRWAGLPAGTEDVLGKVVYAVLAPCLLFSAVAAADPGLLFSELLLVSALASLLCFAIFALIFRRRDPATRILGALSGGYVNANYVGIPVATYVLGNASLVAPIFLLQLLIITPVALTLLELVTTGHVSWRTSLLGLVRNPLIVAVVLGLAVALTGLRLPALVADPVHTIGLATVPVVLIAFGMSLSGRRVLARGPDRRPAVVAIALKTAGMPLIAFGLAVGLGMSRSETYAVTVLAGLPAAQNVFLYAQRSGAGLILVRDAVFLSTVLCVPVLLLTAYLFLTVP